MNVIRYIKNDFVPNVALVVDFSGKHQMLVGDYLVSTSDSLGDYRSACKEASYLFKDQQLDTRNYDIYTIDMYGYRTLFCKIANYVRQVFNDWPELLAEYLQIDLTNVLRGNTCEMSVMSTSTDSYLTAYIDKRLSQQSTFVRNNVYAARLINVAFPKGLVSGFCHETGQLTSNDNGYVAYDEFVNAATVYSLADFKYIDKPLGQQFDVIDDPSTKLTIVMTSSDGDYEQVLCSNVTVDELTRLEQYLTVERYNGRIFVKFNYNPNRTYSLTSNYHVVEQVTLPTTAIQVLSQDMKAHAKNASLLYKDNYVLLNDESKPSTVRLEAVYNKVNCNDMQIRSWRTSDYVYATRTAKVSGNWTAANYQFVPVQTDDKAYDIADFTKTVALYSYGNLCTFLIDAINRQFGQEAAKLHTFAPISNGFDTALDGIDLPTIYNGKVTFRNIRYTMYKSGAVTHDLDGRKFAVVLSHVERLPSEYQEATSIMCKQGAYFDTGLQITDKHSVYFGMTPAATLNTHSDQNSMYIPFGHQYYDNVNDKSTLVSSFTVRLNVESRLAFFDYGINSTTLASSFSQMWRNLPLVELAVQRNVCTISAEGKVCTAVVNLQPITPVNVPFTIGACMYKAVDSAVAPISGRDLYIRYCQIYEGDKLVRNYVPCYRVSDNVAGLYDLVAGKFLECVKPYADSTVLVTGDTNMLYDDTGITAETQISANYVIFKLSTNLKPLLAASGKTSIDSLTIDDFYQYNPAPYMPRMLASYANLDNGFYACRAIATAEVLDMDVPLEPLD